MGRSHEVASPLEPRPKRVRRLSSEEEVEKQELTYYTQSPVALTSHWHHDLDHGMQQTGSGGGPQPPPPHAGGPNGNGQNVQNVQNGANTNHNNSIGGAPHPPPPQLQHPGVAVSPSNYNHQHNNHHHFHLQHQCHHRHCHHTSLQHQHLHHQQQLQHQHNSLGIFLLYSLVCFCMWLTTASSYLVSLVSLFKLFFNLLLNHRIIGFRVESPHESSSKLHILSPTSLHNISNMVTQGGQVSAKSN